jgi:hypothetical protein
MQKITALSKTQKKPTALPRNVFLTGVHQLLVTDRVESAFVIANNCQGQLQTARRISISINNVFESATRISISTNNVFDATRISISTNNVFESATRTLSHNQYLHNRSLQTATIPKFLERAEIFQMWDAMVQIQHARTHTHTLVLRRIAIYDSST